MKFHNIRFGIIKHRKILIKFLKTMSLLKVINYIGIMAEGRLLAGTCRFKPYVATIETSRNCNLTCRFCQTIQARSSFKREYLDYNVYRKFVDENPQVLFLFFAGNGEPSLHPELSGMIDYAKDRNIITVLLTNGTIALDETISPDFLVFSLDYLNREDYQSFKGRDYFDLCTRNIKDYNNRKHKDTLTYLQFFIHEYEKVSREEFTTIARVLGCDSVILKYPIVYVDGFDTESNLKRMLFLQSKSTAPLACSYIYYQAYLTAEGLIAVCCLDVNRDIVLGDCKVSTFSAIWNSPDFKSIREINRGDGNVLDLCRHCPKSHERSPFVEVISDLK